MDKDDVILLKKFESNRRDAFRELFLRYYKPMVLAAKIYSNNDPESEDIVQQFFVKFWEENLHKKINTSIKHYLHISVRNNCYNHLNRLQIKQQTHQSPEIAADVDQAIDFILRNEELEIFENAYREIPPQSRKVFEQIYFNDQSYKETALHLNMSLNTVKSHLKTAIKKIKGNEMLNNYYRDRKKI